MKDKPGKHVAKKELASVQSATGQTVGEAPLSDGEPQPEGPPKPRVTDPQEGNRPGDPVEPRRVLLMTRTLDVSIPRNLRVDVQVTGDKLKREDLAKIKNQFTRWIEGLEEAFAE